MAAPVVRGTPEAADARTGFYLILEEVDRQRSVLAADVHRRELICLEKFFSAGCLEDLRQERLRRLEALRLREVLAQRGLRELDAVQREARREARSDDGAPHANP